MSDRGYSEFSPSANADLGGEDGGGAARDLASENKRLNERLELALGGTGAGMFDICFKTARCFVDRGCLDILGYAEAEAPPAIGDWKRLVCPEDLPGLLDSFQLHLDGKKPLAECEYRVRSKTGEWIWVLSRGRVIRWSDQGKPLWFTGTLLDVTWKRGDAFHYGGFAAKGNSPAGITVPAGNQSSPRQGPFQDLLDAIPCPIFYKDTRGVFLGCNSAFEKFFGRTRHELIGKSSYDLSPSELARIYRETDMRLLRGGGEQVYELSVTYPGGNRREMVFKKAVFGNREPAGFIGVMNDITELREAEAALRESERRYREVVENAQSVIIRTDPKGNISFFNEFAQEFFGYAEEEIIGKNLVATIAPATETSRAHFHNMLEKVRRNSGWFTESECENVRRDGRLAWINWKNKGIAHEEGRLSEILCVGSDVTDRRRAEDELRQTNEYLENIFENSPDAIGIVDAKGRFIRWNRGAAELFGYTLDELRGKSAFDMYADREELEAMLAVLRAEGAVKKCEIRMKHKDGKVGVFEISIGILKDSAGRISGSVCVARDLNPLKKMVEELRKEIALRFETEEALRESEAVLRDNGRKYRILSNEFHALLDAIPDRLLLLDGDYRVIWANRAAAAELQKEDEMSSLIGAHCFEQWHNLEGACGGCPVSDVFSAGRQGCGEVTTMDGRTLEVRSVPVKDEYGNTVKTINLTRDLTEQRKFEKQVRQGQKMEAIGTLAGGIAHDFNNILGIILGYTDLALINTALETTVRYQLEQVQKAVYRAKELIRQILTFSRHGDRISKPVRLSSIISETHKLLRAAVPSNIEIRQEIDPDAEVSELIEADPTQIHQVLMNLCTNAAHAMREHGGILEIGLSHRYLTREDITQTGMAPGSYACITVSDTGHGMSPATMERIFEPFFSTKGPGEGTGLGLSVAYGIVKSHKGSITVYSEKDKGTVFNVYFPSLRAEDTIDHGPAGERPSLNGTGTILLVDDEPALVDVGKKLLENLGYRVEESFGSLEALDAFRADPYRFDLVITDLTMPHMTGVELAEKFIEIRPDIPIILVTGFSETTLPENPHRFGIREFLMKPLITEELSHCIRRVLDFG